MRTTQTLLRSCDIASGILTRCCLVKETETVAAHTGHCAGFAYQLSYRLKISQDNESMMVLW